MTTPLHTEDQSEYGWGDERPVHRIADLKNVLSKYTKEGSDLNEVTMGGDRPVVIRRTETNDMIIELSAAYKSFVGGRDEGLFGTTRSLDVDDFKSIFERIDSPAVTTEEVAQQLGCSTENAISELIELDHRGYLNHKQSGNTTIWWQTGDDTDGSTTSSDLPAHVEKGLAESEKDIEQWIHDNQKGEESMKETFNRICGKPSTEDLRKYVINCGEFDANNFRDYLREDRETSKESKESLKSAFE